MSALPESSVEDSPWERRSRSRSPYARWIGWRLRALVAAALVGCLALFLLLRALAALPALEARLTADDRGTLRLAGRTAEPELVALRTPDGALQPVDALLLQRSSRWLADDTDRVRQARQHDARCASSTAKARNTHWPPSRAAPSAWDGCSGRSPCWRCCCTW
jgi:hypothetical protein